MSRSSFGAFACSLCLLSGACRSPGIEVPPPVTVERPAVISFEATSQYLGKVPTMVVALDGAPGAPERLVVNDSISNSIVVLDGHGDGTFTFGTSLSLGAGRPIALRSGRFLDRARQDVVVVTEEPAAVILVSTRDPAALEVIWTLPLMVAPTLASCDLDGDGLDDLLVPLYSPPALQTYFGRAAAAPMAGPTRPVALQPWSLRCGAIVGDATPDLAYWDGHDFGIAEGHRDGTFGDARVVPVSLFMSGLALGDLDHDGKPDVVAAQPNGSSRLVGPGDEADVVTLLGGGDGTVRAPVGYPYSNDTYNVDVADFDGDGHLDVLTQGYNINVLAGRGDGTLRTPPAYTVPQSFGTNVANNNSAIGDFNGDGLPDLAVVGNSAVVIYLNRTH